jgi:cation transport ATPase
MLHDLRKLGIQKTLMVTRDVDQTAQKVADVLKLSEVHAECLSQDKVRIAMGLRGQRLRASPPTS